MPTQTPILRGSASWEAFTSTVVLRVAERDRLADAERAVRRELDAIDLACSRFRSDSELGAVNAAAGEWVRVGSLLFEAIELALRAAELTDGAVDPTIGRCLELVGYDRDRGTIGEHGIDHADDRGVPSSTVVSARSAPGWRSVRLDRRNRGVLVPKGVVLDLGATAKAWASDRAATAAAAGGCGVLVGIGGDLATAGRIPDEGWPVRVTDDHRGSLDAPGQSIQLSTGALATSSTTVRRWRRRGREMHHIIDPDSGLPAHTPLRTVSVAAASCTEANIAATATLVKGVQGADWLAGTDLPARLVEADGEVRCLSGWPPEENG